MSRSQELIKLVEQQYIEKSNNTDKNAINIGDVVKLQYKVPDGDKERIQNYEGLIISKKNKNYTQAITLRRNIKGIIVEHTLPLYSPRIKSIIKKKESKIRKSKLFFIRKLSEKKIKKKLKFY